MGTAQKSWGKDHHDCNFANYSSSLSGMRKHPEKQDLVVVLQVTQQLWASAGCSVISRQTSQTYYRAQNDSIYAWLGFLQGASLFLPTPSSEHTWNHSKISLSRSGHLLRGFCVIPPLVPLLLVPGWALAQQGCLRISGPMKLVPTGHPVSLPWGIGGSCSGSIVTPMWPLCMWHQCEVKAVAINQIHPVCGMLLQPSGVS